MKVNWLIYPDNTPEHDQIYWVTRQVKDGKRWVRLLSKEKYSETKKFFADSSVIAFALYEEPDVYDGKREILKER